MVPYAVVESLLVKFMWGPGLFISSGTVGPAVPIPTLPLAPSMERIGGFPTAVVVPIDQALTSAGMVEVADFW